MAERSNSLTHRHVISCAAGVFPISYLFAQCLAIYAFTSYSMYGPSAPKFPIFFRSARRYTFPVVKGLFEKPKVLPNATFQGASNCGERFDVDFLVPYVFSENLENWLSFSCDNQPYDFEK